MSTLKLLSNALFGTLTGATSASGDLFLVEDISALAGSKLKTLTRAELAKALLKENPWVVKTGAYAAAAGDRIAADTTAAGFTVTLPAAPAAGDEFYFSDFAGTWATNTLTIDGNGKLFEDGGTRLLCDGAARFAIVYAAGVLTVR